MSNNATLVARLEEYTEVHFDSRAALLTGEAAARIAELEAQRVRYLTGHDSSGDETMSTDELTDLEKEAFASRALIAELEAEVARLTKRINDGDIARHLAELEAECGTLQAQRDMAIVDGQVRIAELEDERDRLKAIIDGYGAGLYNPSGE